jgi:hypothetical protein
MNSAQNPIRNIVFDIDNVLAIPEVDLNSNLRVLSIGSFITAANHWHYVPQGVSEFLQLLLRTNDIRISFFSAGSPERNREFAHKLLERSLNTEYSAIKDKVSVLSRPDMQPASEKEPHGSCAVCGFSHGDLRKDISKVLQDGELLGNAVLLDDSRHNIAYEQHKNFLYIPQLNYAACDEDKARKYDAHGVKQLPLFFSTIPADKAELVLVANGKKILICRNEEWYEINYLHEEANDRSVLILDEETYPDLVASLTNFQKFYANQNQACTIDDPGLIAKLVECVSSFGGKTSKICRRINRIYYAAGLLFHALEESGKSQLPITEHLFALQCSKYDESKRSFQLSVKDENFYRLGLKKLQEINPNLQFLAPRVLLPEKL